MTVLKTETAALAGMSENLWLEKACAHLIPALPLWIIEYAWTKRMMEVLEGVSCNVFNNPNKQAFLALLSVKNSIIC